MATIPTTAPNTVANCGTDPTWQDAGSACAGNPGAIGTAQVLLTCKDQTGQPITDPKDNNYCTTTTKIYQPTTTGTPSDTEISLGTSVMGTITAGTALVTPTASCQIACPGPPSGVWVASWVKASP